MIFTISSVVIVRQKKNNNIFSKVIVDSHLRGCKWGPRKSKLKRAIRVATNIRLILNDGGVCLVRGRNVNCKIRYPLKLAWPTYLDLLCRSGRDCNWVKLYMLVLRNKKYVRILRNRSLRRVFLRPWPDFYI